MNKRGFIVFDFTRMESYRLTGWRARLHLLRSKWRMRNVRMTCEGVGPPIPSQFARVEEILCLAVRRGRAHGVRFTPAGFRSHEWREIQEFVRSGLSRAAPATEKDGGAE